MLIFKDKSRIYNKKLEFWSSFCHFWVDRCVNPLWRGFWELGKLLRLWWKWNLGCFDCVPYLPIGGAQYIYKTRARVGRVPVDVTHPKLFIS